jgi:transcriptional regulator with XRE-family HTH domain
MGTPVAELFGRNLKRVREARGLSQEDLMARADVHRTQVSKYERGETEPQLEIIARLAMALGVSIDSLIEGIGWQEQPPRLLIDAPGPDPRAKPIVLPSSATRRWRSRPPPTPASPRHPLTVIVE